MSASRNVNPRLTSIYMNIQETLYRTFAAVLCVVAGEAYDGLPLVLAVTAVPAARVRHRQLPTAVHHTRVAQTCITTTHTGLARMI